MTCVGPLHVGRSNARMRACIGRRNAGGVGGGEASVRRDVALTGVENKFEIDAFLRGAVIYMSMENVELITKLTDSGA